MRERIGSYVGRHHVGLLALMLVIAGGTAFAASLPKNSVRSKQIKNGQVKSKDVGDGKLKGRDLKDGTVGSAEITDAAISGQDVADGGITGLDLADGGVAGVDLAGDSVGSAQIADGSVAGPELAAGAVSGPKIANGSVGGADLDPETVGNMISWGLSFPNDGAVRDVLVVEGFGRIAASCSPPDQMSATYHLDSPVSQVANFHVFDPVDLAPGQGATNTTGTSGALVAGGAGYLTQDGRLYSYTDDRVLVAEVRGSQSLGAGTCTYRARATVDHNDAP